MDHSRNRVAAATSPAAQAPGTSCKCHSLILGVLAPHPAHDPTDRDGERGTKRFPCDRPSHRGGSKLSQTGPRDETRSARTRRRRCLAANVAEGVAARRRGTAVGAHASTHCRGRRGAGHDKLVAPARVPPPADDGARGAAAACDPRVVAPRGWITALPARPAHATHARSGRAPAAPPRRRQWWWWGARRRRAAAASPRGPACSCCLRPVSTRPCGTRRPAAPDGCDGEAAAGRCAPPGGSADAGRVGRPACLQCPTQWQQQPGGGGGKQQQWRRRQQAEAAAKR